MNRIVLCATLLCSAVSLPVAAQGPAAGVRFHLRLISADTGVAAVAALDREAQLKQDEIERRARALSGIRAGAKMPAVSAPNALIGKPSMVYVKCVRPDSGKWKRESPGCGPQVNDSTYKLLAESTVTSDAQGHLSERLIWAGGDAVVELDASERSGVGSTERMRLKIGFWPRLAKGAAAPQETALRMTNAAAIFGKSVMMTVLFKDGAQILLVVPER
ncbi:MAG: hypothetical protein JWL61_4602 [Gemmatimonadetes bacterium]|nr:hypothetical protein [Gemmatimonadota bacterium]